jgi:hypothetical protein
MRGELRFLGTECVAQYLLDLFALPGGVAITRNVHHAIDEFAVNILAHKQSGLAPFLDTVDSRNRVIEFLNTGLEQLIPREQLQHPFQFPALVVGRVQAGQLHNPLYFASQNRDDLRIHGVNRRCIKPYETVLADYRTSLIEHLDLDIIRISEAVYP